MPVPSPGAPGRPSPIPAEYRREHGTRMARIRALRRDGYTWTRIDVELGFTGRSGGSYSSAWVARWARITGEDVSGLRGFNGRITMRKEWWEDGLA